MTEFSGPVPKFAWLNGNLVAFDECLVHGRSQGAFFGANVFEGLRGYWRPDEQRLTIFRGFEHVRRLRGSMRSLHMPTAYADDVVRAACLDLIKANGVMQDIHMCIVAYFGMDVNYGALHYIQDVGMHITSIPAPRSPAFDQGVHAGVSSWRRICDDSMPPGIKTGANYGNSRLAQHEAVRNGFDIAILLNNRGTVAEAPSANVVMVRDGRLVAPPRSSGALEGITLAVLNQIAQATMECGIERREIDRTELYTADELFICGTLCEIQPVVSVDRIALNDGAPGAVTCQLQRALDEMVRHGSVEAGWWVPGVPPIRASTRLARTAVADGPVR